MYPQVPILFKLTLSLNGSIKMPLGEHTRIGTLTVFFMHMREIKIQRSHGMEEREGKLVCCLC